MALSDIALKRSVTRSERFFPFSSILIKISSRQRLFCKYPLKRAVSHSERFFRFRMVSTMVVSNEAAESDSGLLSERSKKDQSTDRMS